MPKNDLIQKESLLQRIWQSLRFDIRNLQTKCGKRLQISHPGNLNHSDGPDFLSAQIYISNLKWHGSIEIHMCEQDWYHHEHHMDPAFNNVILHVILFADAKQRIKREDGTVPFTLCLKPHLNANLISFIKGFNRRHPRKFIPCSRHTSGILRDDLFHRQLARAHKSYFYQKVYDQFDFWDHRWPDDFAWRRMMVLSLFDGLGISHNRDSMKRLAIQLFDRNIVTKSKETIVQEALSIAGLSSCSNDIEMNTVPFNWNTKGVRPANRPTERIRQGIFLLKKVVNTSMDTILRQSPEKLWTSWIADPEIPGLGSDRAKLLFGICLLPALKIAADMHGKHHRSMKILDAWNKLRVPLPTSYKQVLDKTIINPDIYARCLGTVYQLRHFCFKHRCSECLVFQKSFSS